MQASYLVGSITSRCSGNEPTLLPRREDRRPDSRKGRKSSLLVSQRSEKKRIVQLFLQLATQQLQLQNGVLHVKFSLQLATQRLLRCKLQEKLPRVTWPLVLIMHLRSRATGYLSLCIYVKNMHEGRRLIPTIREIFMKRSLQIFCFCLNKCTRFKSCGTNFLCISSI